ncbi:MAG: methionine--tRNA ligase, partial [Desulfonatronovibrionaceae bacterium]
MLEQLGFEFELKDVDLASETRHWQGIRPGTEVAAGSNLFPRVALEPEKSGQNKTGARDSAKPRLPEVSFEDFQKLNLVTGRILTASPVKGADRLYRLEVDIGEEAPRQIVAGLAEFFSAQELENKEVVVLANLASKKIRGVKSQGMVLAVKKGGEMSLLRADPGAGPGCRVS